MGQGEKSGDGGGERDKASPSAVVSRTGELLRDVRQRTRMKLLSAYTRERGWINPLERTRVSRIPFLAFPLINDIRIYNKRIKISHALARTYRSGGDIEERTENRARQGVIKKSAIVKASDRRINGSS